MNKQWYAMKRVENAVGIDLMDEIGLWGITAADFKRELDDLDSGGDIRVSINSPGGSVFDGIAIYSLLAERRDRVTVDVYGIAASIASVIALAGRELTMREGSFFMIHDPWTLTIGDADDHRKSADILEKIGGQIQNIYAAHTAWTDEELDAAMREETWLTAEEAVEAGFAARVEGEKAAASANFAMLDRFKHPPVGQVEKTQATEPEQEASMADEKTSQEVAQAQVPETHDEQPDNWATKLVAEMKTAMNSFNQELAEVKDSLAHISLGTKTAPSDPKDQYKWFYDALMNIGVKRGMPMDAAATISVGDGFGVPVPASAEFMINVNHYSWARRFGAMVRPAGAQQTKFTTSITKNAAGLIAEHGDYTEKAEPTPITLDLYKLGGRYSLSEETDEDSILAIYNAFQLEAAVAIAKAENNYFLTGTGSSEPSGLTAESAAVTTSGTDAVTLAELQELDESLETQWDMDIGESPDMATYRGPVYVMNGTTAASVRGVLTGVSSFVYTEDGLGRLKTLFGRPVIRDGNMPDLGASNKPIALVNFGAYLIAERRPNLALRVGQDNDNHDITWDYHERVGGTVWDTAGLAVLANAAS
ncbi:MAG: head maturation protease, ClpP-related [Spirochaetaceae bacterium]